MDNVIKKFAKVCPKTGKIKGLKTPAGFYKLFLPFIGFMALLWILFRVISKPGRLNYPCVRAAMPLASGFVGQLIVMAISALAFIRSKKSFVNSPVFFAGVFLVLGAGGTYWVNELTNRPTEQRFPNIVLDANNPVGNAKGIFPGRVVWVHNSNAVNQSCVADSFGHAWFMSENNNQSVVDGMLSSAIRGLTGETNDTSAWNAIFLYHNTNSGRGKVGYTKGEKIFIKINATSSWGGNFSTTNLEPLDNSYYGLSETSAAVVMSVLRQLVNVVGVSQSDIYIGDPLRHIYTHLYNVWHPEFPNVHYLDHDSYYTALGREQVQTSTVAKVYYSDKGTVLHNYVNNKPVPVYSDYLYQPLETATYVINIPQLKGHEYAGVTMFAKDNFGNQTGIDASHLHNGLVLPPAPDTARYGYGLYRVQVNMMGNKYLSGKILFHLLDALWSADWELGTPKKWKTAPFNNEYMASMFASFDPVAIECVGYDFLRSEFTAERATADGTATYVQMPGVDDYLRQAADSTAWPAGIKYDPDNSGVSIPSLGAYEHWNDAVNKQYSRNLGTGNGIELFTANSTVNVVNESPKLPAQFILYPNYPNPFNPSTRIRFSLQQTSKVDLLVYNISGKVVDVIIKGEYKSAGTYDINYNAGRLPSGVYFVFIKAGNYSQTQKMVYLK